MTPLVFATKVIIRGCLNQIKAYFLPSAFTLPHCDKIYVMNRVVVLDKPRGLTSQQAVTSVKHALGVKKAGHAGTLDPMATGVLLVCVGEATKISRFLMDLQKEYLATVKLGERTDTLDAEGEVVERVEGVVPSSSAVLEVLDKFRGEIMQRPPMYSAIKKNGTPLYKLARKGIEVERKERPVTIYSLLLEAYEFPYLTIRLSCSKGTYVRTLADDLARELGTVGHLTALRRTAVGTHRVEDALTLDTLGETLGLEAAGAIEIEEALSHIRVVSMRQEDFLLARNGRPVSATPYGLEDGPDSLLMKTPFGVPFALGQVEGGQLRVGRILHLSAESLNQ
ncbi:hypothetical protein LCGC14_1788660 [marine sediment metagenome]|uniref:tRNA pseudouridine(55) synthase n=1 Tax=marine sediment metagenome TaxID=412755 RepID=A0A0F9JST9_9ZZZZ